MVTKLWKLKRKLPIVAAAFQFELPFCTCLAPGAQRSVLLMVHGNPSFLGRLLWAIYKADFAFYSCRATSTFDFISYFLLNLRSGGRITRKIIFISFNLNTFTIMEIWKIKKNNKIGACPSVSSVQANPFIGTRASQVPILGSNWLFIISLWPCSLGTY